MDSPASRRSRRRAADGAPAPAAAAHRVGEDSFRRLFEWAPSAMVMVDAAGHIVLANAQTEQLFGYRREELVGRSVEMLVPDRFAPQHPAFRVGYVADPHPRPMGMGRDLFAKRRDGSEFPVEIGLNPIDTSAGLMVLASVVDITERQRARERLEAALQEKTVLLNEIHHRVKNNLQMISSLLELQASNAPDPRLQEALGECRSRVRAMALTHQLLYERKDFSRLDLGEYLDRLTQSLLSGYRTRSGRVLLRLEVPEERIYLDLERAIPCGLVVTELVTNAFKHAFPQARAGVIVVGLDAGAGEIRLAVADDGIGLPATFDLAAVSSLGLQLVPLLVEQLHGSLNVEPGAGTRIAMRFPAQAASWSSP